MSEPAPPDRDAGTPPERGAIDPPPFLRRWASLYLLELLALAAIILLLAWLTRSFE